MVELRADLRGTLEKYVPKGLRIDNSTEKVTFVTASKEQFENGQGEFFKSSFEEINKYFQTPEKLDKIIKAQDDRAYAYLDNNGILRRL